MALRALATDFNSFFASVEQQERPELRGQPVIIVPLIAETTGSIAISFEAKKYGLKRDVRSAHSPAARSHPPSLVTASTSPGIGRGHSR